MLLGERSKILAIISLCLLSFSGLLPLNAVADDDLEGVRKRGVLRHIGIPYAHFVTGLGNGLDVEIMQRFAQHLGVKYQFVQSNWMRVFGDLTGNVVKPVGDNVEIKGKIEIRGDVIASGVTILKWREKIVNYSKPTFPTQVWCIARADFSGKPIRSSGNIQEDIKAVKNMIKGHKVMGKDDTCLAPGLYGIDSSVADVYNFPGGVNDMAPAMIKNVADFAFLDVPDTLVALEKWPGKIKVIGPISGKQKMGVAFRKDSPELLKEFNLFFSALKESGEYLRLVEKYYPAVFKYYKDFFEKI